jgi:hypothetical protein
VSLGLACAGPFLDWWNPGGRLTTPGVQAAIIVVFLIVAFVIFTVHLVLAAVHEYGWSKKAAVDVASEEITELRTLWPELRDAYTTAKPALDQLPDFAALAGRVAQVEQKAAASPDTAAVAQLVLRNLTANMAPPAPSAAVDPATVQAP